ncbi:MAG TPA: hypothetical protein VFJ07_06155 [Streptosporangiaceae bacterium]|nr:hypothetical protein [Streptosporangiaceae bacterium]
MTHLRGPAGRLAGALTIALLLAGAVTGSGPVAASVATCRSWTGAQPPSPGSVDNLLEGVAVLTPCDAWAVGSDTGSSGLSQTLTEHWDGSAWTVVPSPDVAGLNNQLDGVRAVSAADVWAVGVSFVDGGEERTLILHWDGHTWQQVISPSPGTAAWLNAVGAVSATDAWAVGFLNNGAAGQPLILHWNGQKWAQVTSPHPGTGGTLSGVAATSASNAWAVGVYFNGTADQGFMLHWNGQMWARQAIPNPGGTAQNGFLNGVAANGASGKAWAVGFDETGTGDKTLILAWTGGRNGSSSPAPPPATALPSSARPPPPPATPGRWAARATAPRELPWYCTGTGRNGPRRPAPARDPRLACWPWPRPPPATPGPSAGSPATAPAATRASPSTAASGSLAPGSRSLPEGRSLTMQPRRSIQRLAWAVAASSIAVWAVAAAATAGAPAAAFAAAGVAPCAAWTGGDQPPDPGGTGHNNTLSGVAVLSPCNAWAVGSYDPEQP